MHLYLVRDECSRRLGESNMKKYESQIKFRVQDALESEQVSAVQGCNARLQ